VSDESRGSWSVTRKDALFVMFLLVASLGINVVLGISRTSHRPTTPPPPLNAGDTLPPLHVRDLKGQSVDIDVRRVSTPTVVYVFTPTCVWCARNLPKIQALGRTKSGQFNFIGVSLTAEGLLPYLDKADLPFPVYSSPAEETMAAYRLNGTPETIVINPESRVVRVWMGAYTRELDGEVSQFFSMKLPSLSEGTAVFGPGRIVCYDPKGRAFSPGAEFGFDGETHVCGSDGRWRTLKTGV